MKRGFLISTFLLLCVLLSAQQNQPPKIMLMTVLSTNVVKEITMTSALSGSTIITTDNGRSCLGRGITWSSTDSLPTIDKDEHTSDGVGDGTFIGVMTGLTPNTLYYVRPYVINEYKIVYGGAREFVTSEFVIPPLWCVGMIVHHNTPNRLEIMFNVRLENIVPSISAFTVTVNGVRVFVESVAINKNVVYVYLPFNLTADDAVYVTYIKPAINPLTEITPYGRIVTDLIDYSVNNGIAETIKWYYMM